jgi:hypothetical protein
MAIFMDDDLDGNSGYENRRVDFCQAGSAEFACNSPAFMLNRGSLPSFSLEARMSHRSFATVLLALPFFAACGALDSLPGLLTLGADDGVPPISGSTTIDVPQDFKCGDPIVDPNKKYTVTSSGTAEACTFSFKQDVLALKAADYSSKPELAGAQFVKSIDIDVNKLGVKDAATGKELSPIDLNGKAFGQTILTKEDLAQKPPYRKSITGAPVDALKSTVQQKKDLVIPVDVVVVVNMTPMPPEKIGLDFDAQPNVVIGF